MDKTFQSKIVGRIIVWLALISVVACGGGGNDAFLDLVDLPDPDVVDIPDPTETAAVAQYISGIVLEESGTSVRLRTIPRPDAGGGPTLTVPGVVAVVEGGSRLITLSAGSPFTVILVSVFADGVEIAGLWEVILSQPSRTVGLRIILPDNLAERVGRLDCVYTALDPAGRAGPSATTTLDFSQRQTECEGQTCGTFTDTCGGASTCGAPVCGTVIEGQGVCVDGLTPCLDLADCASSDDCPGDALCIVESCCGRSVCVPSSNFCESQGTHRTSRAIVSVAEEGPTLAWE